ncbi:MAG: DUF1127 domain-containing protein [Sulfitobacter sp.]
MAAFNTTRVSYGTNGVAARIANITATVIASIVGWNDARVTRNALSTLSDRELDDIGLNRGDIEYVADQNIIR